MPCADRKVMALWGWQPYPSHSNVELYHIPRRPTLAQRASNLLPGTGRRQVGDDQCVRCAEYGVSCLVAPFESVFDPVSANCDTRVVRRRLPCWSCRHGFCDRATEQSGKLYVTDPAMKSIIELDSGHPDYNLLLREAKPEALRRGPSPGVVAAMPPSALSSNLSSANTFVEGDEPTSSALRPSVASPGKTACSDAEPLWDELGWAYEMADWDEPYPEMTPQGELRLTALEKYRDKKVEERKKAAEQAALLDAKLPEGVETGKGASIRGVETTGLEFYL